MCTVWSDFAKHLFKKAPNFDQLDNPGGGGSSFDLGTALFGIDRLRLPGDSDDCAQSSYEGSSSSSSSSNSSIIHTRMGAHTRQQDNNGPSHVEIALAQNILDWAMSSISDESDAACRTMKQEIVRVALERVSITS